LDNIFNILIHVPFFDPDNTLELFELMPDLLSFELRPKSSMIPTIDKDFLAMGASHQFLLRSFQEIQACEKYGTIHLCHGRQITPTDLEDIGFGAF
jgi:hypothetical protein